MSRSAFTIPARLAQRSEAIAATSGFPGARLADMQGMDTSVRLLSKPYRNDELTRALREISAKQPRG